MRPTEVLFLIDKSGSMTKHKRELYDAYQHFIEGQEDVGIDCYVTCELFSTHFGVMHMNTSGQASDVDVQTVCAKEKLESAPKLSDANFDPQGGTPILDAIGTTIDRARFMISDDVNRQVIMVLITDGGENSSKQYSAFEIADMITGLRKGGWKFIYIKLGREGIGYNCSGEKVEVSPEQMGFDTEEYFELADGNNFTSLMSDVTQAIAEYRTTGHMELTWEQSK